MVAPSLDGVAAFAFGVLALAMIASSGEGDEGGLHAVALGVPGALLAATYGASATYGYRAVSACRDLEEDRS